MKSFLLVFVQLTPDRDKVLSLLDHARIVANWMSLTGEVYVLVSDRTAADLRKMVYDRFPMAHYIVVELLPGHKDGRLYKAVWDFINNPTAAETGHPSGWNLLDFRPTPPKE
jgi:hypothetical protein